jgi:polygalacturonase
MRKIVLFITAGLFSIQISAQNYIITEHGVKNDSTKIQTEAIQKVIDKMASGSGGTLVIPKGVYLTGALFFKPKTNLMLEEGGVLKGSDNIDDYPLVPSRMEGKLLNYYSAVINAKNADGFKITGKGTINGNGLKYWKMFWAYRDSMKKLGKEATNLDAHRPRLIFLWNCNGIEIKDVKLRNSGFWTTHLYKCNDVMIQNVDIRSPYKPVPAPSSDGIDLDVCKNVVIKNCYISVNDDAVCIKGGKGPWADTQPENGIVENVLVENCSFGDSHGALTLGSECIHAKDITMRNCVFSSNTPVLRLKRRPDTPQIYENIIVEGVKGTAGTLLTIFLWNQFYNMEGRTTPTPGIIKNISFKDVELECKTMAELKAMDTDSIENITFTNVKIKSEKDTFETKYSKAITLKNVFINNKPVTFDK